MLPDKLIYISMHYSIKNIIVLIICIFLYTGLNAQKAHIPIKTLPSAFSTKAITDTLIPISFQTGTLIIDSALAGGYVCGTNTYGDRAKAQVFYITDSMNYFVEGCGLFIGRVHINEPGKFLKVYLYDLSGGGYNKDGFSWNIAPGYVIDSLLIPVNVLSDNQMYFINFGQAAWVTRAYALGIDFTDFGSNELALISTTPGDAQSSELAWEQLGNGEWHSMLSSWPFDADMGIFSLADLSTAQINEMSDASISIQEVYPNPANNNFFNISVYSTTNQQVQISLFDMKGVQIINPEYALAAGQNTAICMHLPDRIKAGTYLLSVKTWNKQHLKRIVIN